MENRIFINSLPKAGTHLLSQVLINFGYASKKPFLSSTLVQSKHKYLKKIIRTSDGNSSIKIGLDITYDIRKKWLVNRLNKNKKQFFIKGHSLFSEELFRLLKEYNYKIILIIRDPRDVIVSHIHFVKQTPTHYLHNYFSNKKFEELVHFTLTGGYANGLNINSYKKILRGVDQWISKADILTVKFENLVGPKGGGTEESQKESLRQIMEICNINENKKNTFSEVFGHSHTFRKGKIGSWKTELSLNSINIINNEIKEYLQKWNY